MLIISTIQNPFLTCYMNKILEFINIHHGAHIVIAHVTFGWIGDSYNCLILEGLIVIGCIKLSRTFTVHEVVDKQHKIESPRICHIYTRKVNVMQFQDPSPDYQIYYCCH